jgi:nucleoside-diphosphate-sugar epimerase
VYVLAYAGNVVHATLRAAQAPDLGDRAFNVACYERLTVLERSNRAALGRRVERRHAPPPRRDVRYMLADISRAWEPLGYLAGVMFAEGIKQTASRAAHSHFPNQLLLRVEYRDWVLPDEED